MLLVPFRTRTSQHIHPSHQRWRRIYYQSRLLISRSERWCSLHTSAPVFMNSRVGSHITGFIPPWKDLWKEDPWLRARDSEGGEVPFFTLHDFNEQNFGLLVEGVVCLAPGLYCSTQSSWPYQTLTVSSSRGSLQQREAASWERWADSALQME